LTPTIGLAGIIPISCANSEQYSMTIERSNEDNLSITNLSITFVVKVIDNKTHNEISDYSNVK
jgi:hypothetical protein